MRGLVSVTYVVAQVTLVLDAVFVAEKSKRTGIAAVPIAAPMSVASVLTPAELFSAPAGRDVVHIRRRRFV